jgi:MULE transposase domain
MSSAGWATIPARHWSVPQLQAELRDSFHIPLSDDAISASLRRYQIMVAARQQDAALMAAAYSQRDSLTLAIDGLQPEKGHETLYVVRELGAKRIWFAQALLSSAAEEVRGLVAKAKSWAEQMGKPVRLWMSDKQDAFVKAIAAEFPNVPHRYCQNHFLRDVAKPVLEADSHAKVKMRNKVRGLRAIEQEVLAERRAQAETEAAETEAAETEAAETAKESGQAKPAKEPGPVPDGAGDVVLAYCSCVRGILNDGQGGPLHPPGLRMADALVEVRESLQKNLDAKKGGARKSG